MGSQSTHILAYFVVDVGITLRVTNIALPPTTQPGAHEDHLLNKVGRHVGSPCRILEEQDKKTKEQGKFRYSTVCNLVVLEQTSRDPPHNIRVRRGAAEGTINLAIDTAS
jgi:hypothetical protein